MNNSNDDLEALIRSASPADHRSELIPVTITPDMAKGYLSFGVAQSGEIDQSVIDDYALSMQDGEWKAGSIWAFNNRNRDGIPLVPLHLETLPKTCKGVKKP
jgi:hypothetical protein